MCIFSFASSRKPSYLLSGSSPCLHRMSEACSFFCAHFPRISPQYTLSYSLERWKHSLCVCVCVCVFYHTHLVLFMPVCKHRAWNDYALYLFTHQVLRCSLVHIRYSVNICRKWWKHLRIFSDGLKMRSWGDSVRNDSSGIKLLLGVRIGLYSGRGKRVFGSSDHILFFEVWLHKWLLCNC